MDEKTKQYLDDFYRHEIATRQEKREATEDWCRAKLAKENHNSEVEPEGEPDGRGSEGGSATKHSD